jgi:hypothetical protein
MVLHFKGMLLGFIANVMLGWKCVLRRYVVAYLAEASLTKTKSFKTVTPGPMI